MREGRGAIASAPIRGTGGPGGEEPARGAVGSIGHDRVARIRHLAGVDGLRAIAVLAVIAFHAQVFRLDGGFLGVEVFFVISGYLITTLLLAEYAKTGTVALGAFWLRRVRRLLPALLALWLAVVALSTTVATDAFLDTKKDLPGAVFFVSNWWQILGHHSYLMAVDRPPLLRHLWSLAIEEQFYFVWPIAFAYLGHRLRGSWLAAVAVALAFASCAWMAGLYDPAKDVSDIYYRTDTRVSGLLVGMALAAVWSPSLAVSVSAGSRGQSLAIEAAGWVGCLALGSAFLRCNDAGPLVYRGGFLAVDAATAAVIAAVTLRSGLLARMMGFEPLAWIGRRSYSLYLWHWPIFAVTRPEVDVPWTGARVVLLRLGLTLVASELSYRFVEMPARRMDFAASFRPLVSGGSAAQRARAVKAMVAAAVAVGVTMALLRAGPVRAAGGEAMASSPVVLADSTPLGNAAEEPAAPPLPSSTPPSPVVGRGVPIDPAWPKTLTLLTDSVTLGVKQALPAALPDWKVEVVGRPALMVKQVVPEFLRGRGVGSVVVVGVAYNSLFEKNRRNFKGWAALWDREAEALLSDLKARGAKKIVWVTLREPTPDVVTDRGRSQYGLYAWFFPYVNERLRALAERHPELGLADWRAVSDVPGVTYDLIHLSNAGVKLMTSTITAAVLGP
ncbi:MAG TPA: acyltransferase family protein [Polyangiaceae bacterium]